MKGGNGRRGFEVRVLREERTKMRLKTVSCGRAGLSLTELIVLVAVTALVAIVVLPALKGPSRNLHGQRGKCLNNLKNVGLVFRIFATDNGDRFPAAVMMSNGMEMTSIDVLRV